MPGPRFLALPVLAVVILLVSSACGSTADTEPSSSPASPLPTADVLGVWVWHDSHGSGRIVISQRSDGLLDVRDTGANEAQGWDARSILTPVTGGEDVVYRDLTEDGSGLEARLLPNGRLAVTQPERQCSRETTTSGP